MVPGMFLFVQHAKKKTEDRGRRALHLSVETSTAEPQSIDISLECTFLYSKM